MSVPISEGAASLQERSLPPPLILCTQKTHSKVALRQAQRARSSWVGSVSVFESRSVFLDCGIAPGNQARSSVRRVGASGRDLSLRRAQPSGLERVAIPSRLVPTG